MFYAYGGPQRPMSPDTVAAFVKKYGESARHVCTSIPERVHPHMLRHTRAMHLYQDGVPLAMVSEFLGHAQIETTKIYAHADTEMKRKAIQQAANKLNDTIPDVLWNTDDEEMMLKLRGNNNTSENIIPKFLCRNPCAARIPAGLRDSYFIADKSGYSEIQDNQTFSIAGSRKGFGDPRGTLFFELARLAETRKPPYLLFENVVGLINHDHCRTFATILNTLDRLGYGVEWQCLNSKDFGVPPVKNRVYIIGYLDERCRGKVFPFTETAGSSLIQTHGGHQGDGVYSPEGLSCTLAANPGGFARQDRTVRGGSADQVRHKNRLPDGNRSVTAST